ncbi:MAG: DUF1572 domain-containing protein [Calditrichaeota bacterium]|nr:MAG: DUF1572 domain-containing protein [Calditrichota bacterium]
MIIESIKFEYQRYKKLAEGTFAQVPDEALTRVFGDDNNSISILVGHISGNLKSRFTDFLTSDGEKPWRNRDKEFEDQGFSRAEMLKAWEEGWQVLFNTLDSLHDDQLGDRVSIRGVELTVIEALHRSLTHISYHVGQIVFIGKMVAGAAWKSLSIPRGGSAAYNQNPTKEKKPW